MIKLSTTACKSYHAGRSNLGNHNDVRDLQFYVPAPTTDQNLPLLRDVPNVTLSILKFKQLRRLKTGRLVKPQ